MPDFDVLLNALCLFSTYIHDFLLPNLRPSLSICVQQHTVRDVLNAALLFLQLCPEVSGAVQVPFLVLIKPHSTSSTVSFKATNASQWIAVVHEARRRWDLTVLWCARWVGHVGLGAGDYLIKFITVVPCALMRRNGRWGVMQAIVNIFIKAKKWLYKMTPMYYQLETTQVIQEGG